MYVPLFIVIFFFWTRLISLCTTPVTKTIRTCALSVDCFMWCSGQKCILLHDLMIKTNCNSVYFDKTSSCIMSSGKLYTVVPYGVFQSRWIFIYTQLQNVLTTVIPKGVTKKINACFDWCWCARTFFRIIQINKYIRLLTHKLMFKHLCEFVLTNWNTRRIQNVKSLILCYLYSIN